MTEKEISSLTKDEVRVYQEIEKYVAQNDGRSPNIKELAETSDLSQYKVKRVLKSLQRKGIINIKQDGASRRPEILKFIIPAFLGTTGAFVGYKILTERQMKKVAAEQEKEIIPIKTLFPKSQDVTAKPVETITIPERADNREIVYIPTDSGYRPSPVNLTYIPSDFVFEGSDVNVYSGGGNEGGGFEERWAQILTLIGDRNCAMANKSKVESGVMSFQEVYQICAEEGADVDIHSDVGDFERMMCHAAGSYWDEDHCDRSRKPDGTPKTKSDNTMEDVLEGTYDYKEESPKDEEKGYNPFEQWQKDYGKEAERKETETATPSSPRFSPVDIGLPSSNGGKTPCASHSTEAECISHSCTWFAWTNVCG